MSERVARTAPVLRRAALGCALLLGAAAPAVRAEPVLELASMTAPVPSAVTDAAGTLHVVWRDVGPIDDPVRYCRVAAGGTGCTPVVLTTGASASPKLLLRPQDGALVALIPRRDGSPVLLTSTSTDGGTTWSPVAPAASGLPEVEDAAFTPDGSAVDVALTGLDGTDFQRVPLTGFETRVARVAAGGFGFARITHLADGRPLVLTERPDGRSRSLLPAPGADPSASAAWRAQGRTLTRVGARPALDSGPTGTFLLERDAGARGRGFDVRLFRFGPGGFGLASRAGALGRPLRQPLGTTDGGARVGLDVDLAGRLHAVWSRSPERCGGSHCLVYRRTDRNGFGAPVTYPVGRALSADAPTELVVAANSGGSGWIVWRATTSLRAVPLVTPPLGSRVGSRRLGGLRVSIPDRYACVPAGSRITHELRVDGRRGSTRILSVQLRFDDGTPARTLRRPPYRARFALPFAPGTRHVAGAVVRYRTGGATVRTATVGRTFVMC